jgi:hypothetical protein
MPQQTDINPLSDPHDLPDTKEWERLFRACICSPNVNLDDRERVDLLFLLNDFRGMGTVIRAGKLAPLIYPDGRWESQEEYDDFKERYLKPYAKEIKILLEEAKAI